MGVLSFDGVDDDIVFATLAQALKDVSDGAWTCAVLCKRANNDADYHGASYLRSGTGATEAGISLSNQDRIFADIDGENVESSASLAITATGSHIMVLTKAAGTAAMNGWKYEKATATWTGPIQIDASVADQIDATQLDIGSWKQSDMWEGHIGLVGWWEGAMSDTNVKTLENNWRTSDWYNNAHGTPIALFELDVAASSVVDLIGNATGRTVNGAPTLDGAQTLDSWTFDGAGGQTIALGQATETDTAAALTVPKRRLLGQAAEADSAGALGRAKAAALGQAAEVDSAAALGRGVTVQLGAATETNTAGVLGRLKAALLGQATEADSAAGITEQGATVVPLGAAAEVDTAGGLGRAKGVPLGAAAEVDTAGGLGRAKAAALGQAAEVDTARALVWSPMARLLGVATEQDSAGALGVVSTAVAALFSLRRRPRRTSGLP